MAALAVAFIKACWHAEIVDQAYHSFRNALEEAGREAKVVSYDVPGAFEMPLLAAAGPDRAL